MTKAAQPLPAGVTRGAPQPAPITARMKWILGAVAKQIRPCRLCNRQLFFLRIRHSGKLMPFEEDGTNHMQSCPHAAKFKLAKERRAQMRLIETAPLPE